jgi:hypothetical protein
MLFFVQFLEVADMGIMKRNEMCNDASDCVITGLAFFAVMCAWVVLLYWMMSDQLA